jgi:hypothetical protein
MGTPHPKALRAASQEAWPDTGQTLGNVAQGSVRSEQYQRNIRKVPRRIDSYLTNGWRALSRDSRGPSSPIQQGPDSISGCLPAIRIRSRSCSRTSLPGLCSPILGPGSAPLTSCRAASGTRKLLVNNRSPFPGRCAAPQARSRASSTRYGGALQSRGPRPGSDTHRLRRHSPFLAEA